MWRWAHLAVLVGCSFNPGVGPDGGALPGELTVGFAAATSDTPEASLTIPVRVSLSAAATDTVEVAYAITGGTASAGTDYVANDGMLSFAPGEIDKSIDVQIKADLDDESDETIELRLQSPIGARLGTSKHTLTIKSIAGMTCVGEGAYIACFPTPIGGVTLPSSVDTDSTAICSTAMPVGWNGQPDSCFIVGTTIMAGATSVFGSRPLVLWAAQSITITGNIDVASHRAGKTGPGAPYAGCQPFTSAPMTNTNGAGGGAGGTFRTKGGDGGPGTSSTVQGGMAAAAEAAPLLLRAGCNGQKGGASTGTNGSDPGKGGGALYVAAGMMITINAGVTINASGGGGEANPAGTGLYAGGGSAGAGGMIKLHATTISANGAILMANGGGGASGSDNNDACEGGSDPTSATTQAPPGGLGGGGGAGGYGFANGQAATNGISDGSGNGGGGGGGGGGHIESNVPLTGATVSKGG